MNQDRNRIIIPGRVKQQTVEAARVFRKNPTRSEQILWQALRGKQLLGVKFRRQQPVGPFVVDFYASSLRLVIEIDGPVHDGQQEADRARQDILEQLDLTVLRFRAEQIECDLTAVLQKIAEYCRTNKPSNV